MHVRARRGRSTMGGQPGAGRTMPFIGSKVNSAAARPQDVVPFECLADDRHCRVPDPPEGGGLELRRKGIETPTGAAGAPESKSRISCDDVRNSRSAR